MSTSSGRNDRRRRILSDGGLTPDTGAPASHAAGQDGGVRRYATNDDSASFAVARRVLPHRRRMILGVSVLGLLGVAAVLAAHVQLGPIQAALRVDAFPALDLTSGDSIARWAAAALLLVVGGLSLLVYGLRRRRTDDVRGVYRWWLSAATAASIGSLAVATGAHRSLAEAAQTAWGLAPAEAVYLWWAGPLALAGGAIAVRTLLDLKHCVPAALAAALGLLCGVAVLVAEFDALPGEAAAHSLAVSHGASLAGLLLVTVSLLCYCRRIVLEADGVINAPAQKPVVKEAKKIAARDEAVSAGSNKAASKPKARQAAASITPAETTSSDRPTPSRQRPKPAAKAAPKPTVTQWTDGSDGDADYDDEGGRRKLSKAERKRLRKLKARQNRAA